MWVAAAVRKIVPARMRAACEQQQARPTGREKHYKRSQGSHRPCSKPRTAQIMADRDVLRLADHIAKRSVWQMQLAGNIAKQIVWRMLLAEDMQKHRAWRMWVAGGHRQTQGVSAHSLSMTESHRSHAARKASRDSCKPSCPAAHEGNHQICKKPRASNSADAQASQQATIESAELAGPDQGGC